jgi:hypothetical protein
MLNEIERAQLASTTIQCFSGLSGRLTDFPGLLKKLIEQRVWERRVYHGKLIELPNLRALITEKPLNGWGEDPKKIEAVIKDNAEVLAMYRAEMLGEEGGDKRSEVITGNNITSDKRITGTSRAYSIDRVQRGCDAETVAAVMAGTISPNAALERAGIRKNRQISMLRDPARTALKIRERMGDEYAAMLKSAL